MAIIKLNFLKESLFLYSVMKYIVFTYLGNNNLTSEAISKKIIIFIIMKTDLFSKTNVSLQKGIFVLTALARPKIMLFNTLNYIYYIS